MKDENLQRLREKIDGFDKGLLLTLGKRMRVVQKVGEYKKNRSLEPLDKKRWEEVLKSRLILGKSAGLSSRFIRKLLSLIHYEALLLERETK